MMQDWGTEKGAFVRQTQTFRNWITADGSSGFPAEPNRYHLYISHLCPWANRTHIVRNMKGLEDVIGLSVTHYRISAKGWDFHDGPGVIPDTVNGALYLSELYMKTDPSYSKRVTVPVLWDCKRGVIVNNESSEIIRMLNSEFNAFAKNLQLDLYPERLRPAIDEVNTWVYDMINNGVYKTGFAKDQDIYEKECRRVFEGLDRVESILSRQRYLAGDTFTEADVRLFTTLVRFDPAYHGHFKCNLRRMSDYPNILGFAREVYQMPGVKETVNLFHIKHGYYGSQPTINGTGVVPLYDGPDLTAPHNRDHLPAAA